MKKKLFIVLIFLIFLISFSSGAINPYPPFCAHQGYQVTEDRYCDFGDGTKCSLEEFYKGYCGTEYQKEFPCVKEGNHVFSFEECCEGSEPYIEFGIVGQPSCEKTGFLSGWMQPEILVIFVVTILIIAGFLYMQKKKK